MTCLTHILLYLPLAAFLVWHWWRKLTANTPKIEKAKIFRVGYVDFLPNGIPHIHGWGMDGDGRHVQYLIVAKNQIYFCGYSVAELHEIASRRDEWPNEWEVDP